MCTVCGGHRTLPSRHWSAAVVVGDQRSPSLSWWQIRRDETFLSPCTGGGGTVKNCVAAPDSCALQRFLDHGQETLILTMVMVP